MKRDFKLTLIESIIYIILGSLFFIPQVNFLQIILCVIGALILIFGIYLLIKGLVDNSLKKNATIVSGIFLIVIGIVFVTLVWFVFSVIAVLIGILFIAASVVGLLRCIKEARPSLFNRLVDLLVNIFYLVIGILLIVNCTNSFSIVSYFIGGSLILDGVLNLIVTIYIYREYKKNIIVADNSKHVVEDDNPIVVDIDVTNDHD